MSVENAALPILTFPSLFVCADSSSNEYQRDYFRLLGAEYIILLLAAGFSMNLSVERWYFAVYAFLFVLALACLGLRSTKKYEQDWYKCRALAESVKTSAWRYAMGAEPFDDAGADARFVATLNELIKGNPNLGERIAGKNAGGAQITEEMEETRLLDWQKRKRIYLQQRIIDQRRWYETKAVEKRELGKRWEIFSFGVYVVALALVLWRIVDPSWMFLPVEPLIVLGSAVIGWSQVKKFNELASTYALTAQEIGLIEVKIKAVNEEAEFGEFINEAEQAFSREHIQWVARQTHGF